MSADEHAQVSESVVEQAATWLARQLSGEFSEMDRQAFERWRAADPLHEETFAELRQIWVSPALSSAVAGTVRRRSHAASVALIGLVGCALLFHQYWSNFRHSFVTRPGLVKSVDLEDGSHMVLAGDSAIDYRFDSHQRLVTLARGEAIFDVTHDVARPFTVQTKDGFIRDVGTAFDVRLEEEGSRVTVTRGAIELSSHGQTVRLYSGQQATYGNRVASGHEINAAAATAWARGTLLFESSPLSFVVSELNRYTDERILLVGRGLNSRQISGVIDLDHADNWLDTLCATQGLRIVRLHRLAILY
jgi:transmembrane sensor